MKALATVALLGTAYAFEDNEFLSILPKDHTLGHPPVLTTLPAKWNSSHPIPTIPHKNGTHPIHHPIKPINHHPALKLNRTGPGYPKPNHPPRPTPKPFHPGMNRTRPFAPHPVRPGMILAKPSYIGPNGPNPGRPYNLPAGYVKGDMVVHGVKKPVAADDDELFFDDDELFIDDDELFANPVRPGMNSTRLPNIGAPNSHPIRGRIPRPGDNFKPMHLPVHPIDKNHFKPLEPRSNHPSDKSHPTYLDRRPAGYVKGDMVVHGVKRPVAADDDELFVDDDDELFAEFEDSSLFQLDEMLGDFAEEN